MARAKRPVLSMKKKSKAKKVKKATRGGTGARKPAGGRGVY